MANREYSDFTDIGGFDLLATLRNYLPLLLFVQPSLQAQDFAAIEQDFFADSPLVLTVSRMSKPLPESPASVSIIDRQMIEASGVRDVADLFRLVPGFVVGFHSGHAPAVTYHGLGLEFGRQIQVLIDGRSVFIPSFGGVPWSNLPLLIEDIERIEVIRGPNAVTYGANAFLATINIITRHAAEDRGARFSVRSSDNAHPDIEDAYLRIGSQNDDLDWRLSLGTNNDEGFAAINDSKRIGKFNFRVDLLSRSNQFWTLQFGSSSSTAGRGFPQDPDNPTDIERDEKATNSYLNIQWEGIWESSSSSLRLTHTRQDVTDNFDPGPFTLDIGAAPIAGITTFIDFDRTSNRTDLEFAQTDDINDSLRLVYGGSLRQDKVKSLFLLNEKNFNQVDTSRLFGAVEWRLDDNWLLDIGVMFEDSSLTSLQNSPRLSLIRKFGQKHALRLVASAANRNPILWEFDGETEFVANVPLFGTVVVPTYRGNDDLDPEQIESYEVGLRSQLDNNLASDIKLFRYRISDHIVLTETSADAGPPLGTIDISTNSNDGSSEIDGIELALDYAPDNRFEMHFGVSVIDVESRSENYHKSFPDYTAFTNLQYRFNDSHVLSGTYYYLDQISWLDSQRTIAPARRLDLRYAYHWRSDFQPRDNRAKSA